MKYKIAVVGGGNGGVISSIMSVFTLRELGFPDPEITVFHDPKISTEIVGQGTTLNVSHAIYSVLKVNEKFDNPVGITPKVGFFYKNWAKNDNELLYKLSGSGMSYHYDPKLLQKYFLNCKLFKFIEGNFCPKDISSEYDLVFDCRGKSYNDPEDYEDLLSPVNCCLLGRSFDGRGHEVWTENISTPDGWCFKIPLSDGHSYGYVFNDKITSENEAKKNFKDLFGMDTIHKVSFKNYMAKKIVSDNEKIILNGNRLFFLDPLESTATPMYGSLAQAMIHALVNDSIKESSISFHKRLKEVHEWVLWHYYYGSYYDTKFWRHAKNISKSFEYSNIFLKRIGYVKKSCDWEKFNHIQNFPTHLQGEFSYTDYAVWLFNNENIEKEKIIYQ